MKTVSSNRIIPKELLSSIQRWELHSFAPSPKSPKNEEEHSAGLRQKGFEQGFEEGRQAGLAAAAEISAAESARLGMLLASASAGMATLGTRTARETVELALAIAKQVLRRELSQHPDAIVTVVEEALACMPHAAQDAQLYLHPLDADLVQARIGDDLERNHWRIVRDGRLSLGGCRVAATCGDVDATMETRWTSVLTALEKHDDKQQLQR